MPLGLSPRQLSGICPIANESIQLEGSRVFGGVTGAASAVWPTANLAIYVPFTLAIPGRVRQLGLFNGTVVSGNFDVGIYRYDGTRLISTGSTAQAGTSALQFVAAALDLPPGRYYLGLALDNITATVFRQSQWTAAMLEALGVGQQASAFPLPATMTPVAPTNTNLPVAFAQFGRLL
jgi:hypothetical protein